MKTKEQIAAKRDFVVKGMRLVSDCEVRTTFDPPRSDDLDQIRKRLDALKVKIARL